MCWFFFKIFVYLIDRDTAREGTQAGGVGEGEAGFPQSREPSAGLDPRMLGSWPEPKADTQRLSHPGAHKYHIFEFSKRSHV